MKDSRLKGIIALVVVTILAFGVIYGSKILVKDETGNNNQTQEDLPGAIDVTGAEGIVSAREITDDSGTVTAYSVVAKAKGFAPPTNPVTWEVIFENDAKTIKEVKIVSHGETPGYGAAMEESSYLDQFKGIPAPIYLKGKAPVSDAATDTPNVSGGLQDGIYSARTEEADSSGFIYLLTIKVENGNITSVVFDAMNREGEYKSYLSTVGEYTMTEDGLTWKEQADALANYILENQSIEGLTVDENGKTDVVSGVSISIDDFLELTEKALVKAASGEGAEAIGTGDTGVVAAGNGEVGEIDGVSGATVTTDAILQLVNNAYEFISAYAGK
ncbi:MAG: FMN-binding protein [Anaerolineaceae bacterium]|nr:MAG: FMN-binding protein [Anaerolineaceae bacterium]